MHAPFKGLLIGLVIGAGGVLLVQGVQDSESVPEQLAKSLGCDEPNEQTAAWAMHGSEYSGFAATHATEIAGVGGCTAGPATLYMEYVNAEMLQHALASLRVHRNFCVLPTAYFDDELLSGDFEELCAGVGGEVEKR